MDTNNRTVLGSSNNPALIRSGTENPKVLIDAVEYDVIKKSGSWFSYGESKLAQGREAVKQLLTDNVELCDEIEAKIREVLANVQD